MGGRGEEGADIFWTKAKDNGIVKLFSVYFVRLRNARVVGIAFER